MSQKSTLTKVSNRNSFRTQSESFRNLRSSQCESIQKKFAISFVENQLKINRTQSKTSIRMNSNQSGIGLI